MKLKMLKAAVAVVPTLVALSSVSATAVLTTGCGGCYPIKNLRVDGVTCLVVTAPNAPFCGGLPELHVLNNCAASVTLSDVSLLSEPQDDAGTAGSTSLTIAPAATEIFYGKFETPTSDQGLVRCTVGAEPFVIRWNK